MGELVPILGAALVIAAAAVVLTRSVWRRRHVFGTPADRATFRTLHSASLAAPPLRAGLTDASAQRAARHLRALLGTPSLAVTDADRLLAWDGAGGDRHGEHAVRLAANTLDGGCTEVFGPDQIPCAEPDCPLRHAIITPLTVEERVIGTLQVYAPQTSAGLVRAAGEVADWVSGQLELAELDRSRRQAMEAEVRALRAQISPHFVYNSLTAIASFVRTDPERARELLVEFADFTRYSFRKHGEFTTLAEELRSIDRYLTLETARHGDRLRVTLQVAPEVLPVVIPFLSLQPLVENALRHGLADQSEPGQVTITATEMGNECLISVEDDGSGIEPERVRQAFASDGATDSIGLGNVDERLRAIFGAENGLVVETAPGVGTKVTMRVPKFHRGVHLPAGYG